MGTFVSWCHGKITLKNDDEIATYDVAPQHEVTLDGEPCLSTDLKPNCCTVTLTGDPVTLIEAECCS